MTGGDGRTPEALPPLVVLSAIVVAGYVALFIAALVAQVPVRLIDYKVFGLDLNDFWTAAGDVLAGRDPYARPRFVTPPLSWLPFLPLAPLSQPAAAALFFAVNAAAVTLGLSGLVRRFGLSRLSAVSLAMACALSPSTLMLLERGNLDGLVFLALCGFLVAGSGRFVGPLLLAVATCLKLYPAVFILAAAAHRRAGAALLAGGAVLLAAAATPSGHLAFLHNQVGRAGGMKLDENLSGLALFWLLDEGLFAERASGLLQHPAMLVGGALYASALAACLWRDRGLVGRLAAPDRLLLMASYAAFCVNMPSLVYLYSGVSLFLLAAALGLDGLSASPALLRRIAVALGCAMLPAKSFALTLGTGWAAAANLVPPAASLALIILVVGLRVELGGAVPEAARA